MPALYEINETTYINICLCDLDGIGEYFYYMKLPMSIHSFTYVFVTHVFDNELKQMSFKVILNYLIRQNDTR